MRCQLVSVNRKYGRCTVCNRLARYASGDANRECPGEPVPVGLGDMVKAGLNAIGITQERVAAVLGSTFAGLLGAAFGYVLVRALSDSAAAGTISGACGSLAATVPAAIAYAKLIRRRSDGEPDSLLPSTR